MQADLTEPQTTDEAVERIVALARDGFNDWSSLGDIRATRDGDLLLLSYTHAAQYAGRWNAWERACRGLVVNTAAGYVAARPFDKFFNWGEGGRAPAPGTVLDYVTEKVDGSLIIAFWHGGWRTATRGSLSSPQAAWARERIEAAAGALAGLPAVWTLLFEAVYPENRIVVDYGDREELVLLAMRHRGTGRYAPWDFVRTIAGSAGFALPRVYGFHTAGDIERALELMDASEEGFVAVYSDGSRFKFKSAAYLALHRAVTGLTYKRAVEALRDGTADEIAALVPEELRTEWDGWLEEIRSTVLLTKLELWGRMEVAPLGGDRKTFALWAQRQERWARPMLFALYDSKDVEPLIYKFILDGGQR